MAPLAEEPTQPAIFQQGGSRGANSLTPFSLVFSVSGVWLRLGIAAWKPQGMGLRLCQWQKSASWGPEETEQGGGGREWLLEDKYQSSSLWSFSLNLQIHS